MKSAQKEYNTAEQIHIERTKAPPRSVSGVVPRTLIRPAALSYRLLKPREAGPVEVQLLEEAYDCWRAVWQAHFGERDGLQHLPSDDFTRQDEIGTLFHDDECIGMTAYRWLDMTNHVYEHDSYFKSWPREAIDGACALGTRIGTLSYLTVAPAWRRAAPYSPKELLLALATDRFLDSDVDAVVGTTRNDRNMNDLGYRLGYRPLVQGLTLHGGLVDLVVLHKKSGVRKPLSPLTEEVIGALRPRTVGRQAPPLRLAL